MAALAEAQEKPEQTCRARATRERSIDRDDTGHRPQNEPGGEHQRVHDHYVLEPPRIGRETKGIGHGDEAESCGEGEPGLQAPRITSVPRPRRCEPAAAGRDRAKAFAGMGGSRSASTTSLTI